MFARTVLGTLSSALMLVATSAKAECSIARLSEFPTSIVNGRPITTIKVNGQEAKFFLNNSVFFNLIHADAAKRFQLLPVDKYGRIDVVDASRPKATVGVALAKTVTGPGLDLKDINFITDDSGRDPQVDGDLGQNLLTVGDTEFDLPNGVVRLFKATGCKDTSLAYWDEAKKGFSIAPADSKNGDHFTLVKMTVNGQQVTALLASGASYSFLTEAGAKRLHLMPANSSLNRIGERVWADIASIKLGDEEIRSTKLSIAKFDLGETSEHFDMLLGVDFLQSHHVYISHDQKRMYFTYSGGRIFAPPPARP